MESRESGPVRFLRSPGTWDAKERERKGARYSPSLLRNYLRDCITCNRICSPSLLSFSLSLSFSPTFFPFARGGNQPDCGEEGLSPSPVLKELSTATWLDGGNLSLSRECVVCVMFTQGLPPLLTLRELHYMLSRLMYPQFPAVAIHIPLTAASEAPNVRSHLNLVSASISLSPLRPNFEAPRIQFS